MKNINFESINRIGTILALFILLAICFKIAILEPIKLKKNTRYTVGYFKNKSIPLESSFTIKCDFTINEIKYIATAVIDDEDFYNKSKKGDRFFIKYHPLNPKNSKILIDIKVPDSLIVIPKNGWKSIPIVPE